MTMQYLWRPLGLCTLAAALWIGVPAQANADTSDMGQGTMLVARNDQQYGRGQGADTQYHRDGKATKAAKDTKAAKVKNNGKNAPKKDVKGNANGKHDVKKNSKVAKAAQPGAKGQRADKMTSPNGKNAKGNKAAHPKDNRSGKRPDAQSRAPQRFEGDVNN
ncbi:MAG: hypothetical protein QM579_00710 [Desulfovibrio sp.]|uniref:hypothetical protein n=1 Tax=Desulfovibrio sp. TaxID=885 RepID=UPI0039E23302